MKKILLLITALVSVSCQAQQKDFSQAALDNQLISLDGTEIAFKDIINKYRGKTVVMEVWASWCSDCVKAMPKLKELQNNHPDVVYLFISMDKAEDKWKSGIEKHQIKGEHYWATDGMKGKFGQSIDLDWIPRYIIIDKKGNVIVYRAIETDFEKINNTLKSQQ